MRTTGSPDVVVLADLAEETQRGAARQAVRVLTSRRCQVDVVTMGSVTETSRDLAGWRRASRVRVRHLLTEAVGVEPGTLLRGLSHDRATQHALASEPWAAPDVVPVLGAPVAPEERDLGPGTIVAFGTGSREVVRERRDVEDRTYQRDFVDGDGITRYVSWVNRETGEVSSILELDRAAGTARRRGLAQWIADRLAEMSEDPPAVVSTSDTADEVVGLLPEPWRVRATMSGVPVDDLRRVIERTGARR